MIAVIGHTGVVGNAVYQGFSDFNPLGISLNNLDEYPKIEKCDVVFICVPTPMDKDGAVDMSYIYDSMDTISKYMKSGIIVIKSTVLPGTNALLSRKYPQFDFVSSPEFLTASNPVYDFTHQDRIVIGTQSHTVFRDIKELYESSIFCTNYIYVKPIEAELIKYLSNSFLAMKVIFANECKNLCDKVDADWNDVLIGIGADRRIGCSHLRVTKGYDGMCFPKDVSGIVKYAEKLGVKLTLLEETNNINHQLRPELYD